MKDTVIIEGIYTRSGHCSRLFSKLIVNDVVKSEDIALDKSDFLKILGNIWARIKTHYLGTIKITITVQNLHEDNKPVQK